MPDVKKASPIEAIAELTKVVDLPEPGPAGVISIEIRRVHAAVLLAKVGTMPSFSPDASKPDGIAALAKIVTDSAAPIRAVAEACIVSPVFSFGEAPEPGKAWWGHLSWANQVAVFAAGMEYAGLQSEVKAGTDADAARQVVRFHGSEAGPKGVGRNGVRRSGGRRSAGQR